MDEFRKEKYRSLEKEKRTDIVDIITQFLQEKAPSSNKVTIKEMRDVVQSKMGGISLVGYDELIATTMRNTSRERKFEEMKSEEEVAYNYDE